jgi:ribosomal protein S12 methylthiotransferase accessory factor
MQDQRFFAVPAPGLQLSGCDMHQRLLAAYDKLHVVKAA